MERVRLMLISLSLQFYERDFEAVGAVNPLNILIVRLSRVKINTIT